MKFRSEVGPDGKVRLDMPVDLPPGPVDAVLVLQPLHRDEPPYDTLEGAFAGELPELSYEEIQNATDEMNEAWKKNMDRHL